MQPNFLRHHLILYSRPCNESCFHLFSGFERNSNMLELPKGRDVSFQYHRLSTREFWDAITPRYAGNGLE
jgi:hypothetical protein